MSGKLRKFWTRFAAEGVFWQTFWTYLATPIAGIGTALLGVLEHLPLMWAVMAGFVSFAMAGLGLLSFYQWRIRRSAEHKIVYQRALVTRPDSNADKIILGLVMKNLADFPMEVSLIKVRESVAQRIPRIPRRTPHTMTVDASNDFYFAGADIDLTGVADDPMTGEFDVEMTYGRVGGTKYSVSYSQGFQIPMDVKKPFVPYIRSAADEQPSK